jgi:hypothetical protein
MKIYKIALEQFQLIPQNVDPNTPNNPDVQLQNLQNAQQGLQYLLNVMQIADELYAKIAELDDALGGDTGLKSIIQQKIIQSVAQTPAYSMLAKMGLMGDPNDLTNNMKMSQITTQIQQSITYYSQGM